MTLWHHKWRAGQSSGGSEALVWWWHHDRNMKLWRIKNLCYDITAEVPNEEWHHNGGARRGTTSQSMCPSSNNLIIGPEGMFSSRIPDASSEMTSRRCKMESGRMTSQQPQWHHRRTRRNLHRIESVVWRCNKVKRNAEKYQKHGVYDTSFWIAKYDLKWSWHSTERI